MWFFFGHFEAFFVDKFPIALQSRGRVGMWIVVELCGCSNCNGILWYTKIDIVNWNMFLNLVMLFSTILNAKQGREQTEREHQERDILKARRD